MTAQTYAPALSASREAVRRGWTWFLVLGILWVVLGALAIIAPLAAALAIQTLIGVLLLVGGIAQIVQAFRSRGWGAFGWHLLSALAEVVAASKAKPGSLNMAFSGNGTVAHLASVLFQKSAGVDFTHVPYKGAAQAATDVVSGRVELYLSSVPTLIGQIKTGKMRPIAVTSLKRVDDLPQVPTIAESGVKDFEAVTWFGFVAPAGTPKDIVALLNTEINKALQSADVKKKLSDQGADVLGGTPEAFGSLIRSDLARWAPIVKASGATLD